MPIRYVTRPTTDKDGEPILDANGEPVMETVTAWIPVESLEPEERKAYEVLQAERRGRMRDEAFAKRHRLPGSDRPFRAGSFVDGLRTEAEP